MLCPESLVLSKKHSAFIKFKLKVCFCQLEQRIADISLSLSKLEF